GVQSVFFRPKTLESRSPARRSGSRSVTRVVGGGGGTPVRHSRPQPVTWQAPRVADSVHNTPPAPASCTQSLGPVLLSASLCATAHVHHFVAAVKGMHCVSHFGSPGAFPHWGSHEGRGFGAAQGPHCHHGPLSFGPLGPHGHGHGFGFGRWAPYGGPFAGRGRWGAWSAWGRPGFDVSAPWQAEQSGCGPCGSTTARRPPPPPPPAPCARTRPRADTTTATGTRLGGRGAGVAGRWRGRGRVRATRALAVAGERLRLSAAKGACRGRRRPLRVWWATTRLQRRRGRGPPAAGDTAATPGATARPPAHTPARAQLPAALGAFHARDR
ncbi:Protein of unknown function, partial [Gryllus bimaculatus]